MEVGCGERGCEPYFEKRRFSYVGIDVLRGGTGRVVKILISIASLCVTLIVAEVFLRVFMPVDYRRPPTPMPQDVWRELVNKPSDIRGLDYELRPGAEKFTQGALVKTNAYGMRDVERRLEKGANVFRIAAIGDSFTFGFGVGNDETYPSILERLLNETGSAQTYEVLNFGVGGYSSRDEAFLVRGKVMQWRPDMILIGYVFNDPETEPISPLHAYYHETVWWEHSHFLRLVARAKASVDVRYFGGGDYVSYLHHYPPKWNTVLQAFSDIRDAARGGHIKVVLAIFPLKRDLSDQVRDAALGFGFSVVDLNEPFSSYRPGELMQPDGHPNAIGHQVAARAIRDVLLSERLVPRYVRGPKP